VVAAVNSPNLIGVRAPWDRPESPGVVERLKALPATFAYIAEYGFFWAPESLDPWKYRRHLRELDWVCLRALRSEGSLTAAEMIEWLGRKERLRTNSEKTGIYSISEETIRDWLVFASRRSLVTRWVEPGADFNVDEFPALHWMLSESGGSAFRSPLRAIAVRFPYGSLLTFAGTVLLGGGGLAVAIGWLKAHENILMLAVGILVLLVYVVGVFMFINRSRKRETPGLAVVLIETVRGNAGTNTPIPL
jgi:hypothetical protein